MSTAYRWTAALVCFVSVAALAGRPAGVRAYGNVAADTGAPCTGLPINVADGTLSDWACGSISGPPARAGNHIVEYPFAEPVLASAGDANATSHSDLLNDSSAFRRYNTFSNSYDTLTGGNSADIREFYATWDASALYLAVVGPNKLFTNGPADDFVDLFIAIDTDAITTSATRLLSDWNPGSGADQNRAQATPADKRVDFAGWDPEYFVAIFNVGSGASFSTGYADLRAKSTPNSGISLAGSWGHSNYDATAMSYEVRLTWASLGLAAPDPASGMTMNFAVFTTYGNSNGDGGAGYDVYDSAPGIGQGSSFEQHGDNPYDADYCGGALDPASGLGDTNCVGAGNTDLGPGIYGDGGAFPASDNASNDIDTISEYFQIRNVGMLSAPTAVTLLSATAARRAGAVRISWAMGDEGGVDLYRLARQDGDQWRTIATLAPSGLGVYRADDLDAPAAAQRYRLSASAAGRSTTLADLVAAPLSRAFLPAIRR